MGLLKNDIIPIFRGHEIAIATKEHDEPEIEKLVEENAIGEKRRGRKPKVRDNSEGDKETGEAV